MSAILRDKGQIGPASASIDSQVVPLTDAAGHLYLVYADLPNHTCHCWSELYDWLVPARWTGGNLLGWSAVIHGGAIKLCGRIWPEVPGGDIPGNHAVVATLWPLP